MALKQMEARKVRVGENDYYIKPFSAFKAAHLTAELASVLAPLAGVLVPLAGSGSVFDIDVNNVMGALATAGNIDADKVEALMKRLLLGGHVIIKYQDEDGNEEQEPLNMDLADEIFCGEVQDMYILCGHVIKLNFNGFFEKLVTPSGKADQVAMMKPRTIL